MRLAICAASAYERSPNIPSLRAAPLDLETMQGSLATGELALSVVHLPADRALVEELESFLVSFGERVETLILYFSGYVLWPEGRGPGLLLDGERMGTLSLKRLNRLLAHYVDEALVILDVVQPEDGARPAEELLAGVGEALGEGGAPISTIAAVRTGDASDGLSPSAFTNLASFVLDWQKPGPESLSAAALFELLRAESAVFEDVPPMAFFAGSRPVCVMPAALADGDSAIGNGAVPSMAALTAAAEARALSADSVPAGAWAVAELSAQCLARGDFAAAAEYARAAVRSEPAAQYLRLALTSFEKLGESDAVWHAASALDYLGEADINESLVASQYRPEGLIAANSSLTDADWSQGHFWPERDQELTRLEGAIRMAALEVGMSLAKKKGRVPELDPASVQDPLKSTTTLAKTLLWTSRLLGVSSPALYVVPEVPGELRFVPSRSATVIASRAVGSGLAPEELAFLWGRQLAYARPEHYLLAFFPERSELSALLEAALGLGSQSRGALHGLGDEAKRLAAALKKRVRGVELEQLREAARQKPASAAEPMARDYLRSVELAALRAGLLACGNLETAARLCERFPFGQELELKRQQAELVSFSIGKEYVELRRRLGVALS